MQAKLTNFVGTYERVGSSKLVKVDSQQQVEFIVGTRKEPTMKKPKEYLICSIDKGRPQYFSSIYNRGNYKQVEYGGVLYTLHEEQGQVILKLKEDAGQ